MLQPILKLSLTRPKTSPKGTIIQVKFLDQLGSNIFVNSLSTSIRVGALEVN